MEAGEEDDRGWGFGWMAKLRDELVEVLLLRGGGRAVRSLGMRSSAASMEGVLLLLLP